MLEMRPNCACCDRDLPWESKEAMICTFECTFCADCVATVLGGKCPNCGGAFAVRPVRPAQLAAKYPPSKDRILSARPDCAGGRAT